VRAESFSTIGVSPSIDAEDAPGGERKLVTALFADVKGSTELVNDLDPAHVRRVVDPALQLMIEAVRRYDGHVVRSAGDAIFALFGAPTAHEDHPQRALYAALRMQQELRRYSAKLREEGTAPLELRIGANTGEVVVRFNSTGEAPAEYTPIGHTTNLASRMQALAPTGSIAVTEATQRACEGYFTFRALGPTRVKGVSAPVNVHEVTGIGALRTRLQRAAGRGLSKFVGREREMMEMRSALELVKQGRGQIVAAMGEAGLGKSRLFYEFKVTSQSRCLVLETFSVSHGKASSYLPVIELLNNYLEIEAADDARKRREKITGKVLTLDRMLEDTLPYLFALLGVEETAGALAQMDAQVRRRRTLEAIKRILLRESLNQPLIVIFEDLHWVDPETQVLLDLMADAIANARVLLLVNYRPEYHHGWGSKTHYAQLRLDPLGKASAEELLDALLGNEATLQTLKRLVIEKTQGNPFFMEETVQVLLDEGVLVRNGAVKLTKPLSELHIPPTVQVILASRIDRLPADEKDLLQNLAVMGKEFPLGLVKKVTGKSDDELERMLGDLQLGEFIYEQPALPDVEYTFKHALTLEVAYNSVPTERCRVFHERTGDALESLYAERIDDHLAELVHHYTRSPNLDKAADYLASAARQAHSRSAFSEALSLARAGVELITTLPPTLERRRGEFNLYYALLLAARVVEGWASSQALSGYRRMLELAHETNADDKALFMAVHGMWLNHAIAAQYEESGAMATQTLDLAKRIKMPATLADAHHARAFTLYWTGHISEALPEFDQAIEVCPDGAGRLSVDGNDPLAWTLSYKALCTWHIGYPDQALRAVNSLRERAFSLNQPYTEAYALWFETYVRCWRGEVFETQELCEKVAARVEERGFALLRGLNRINEGWVASVRGQHEQGIALTRSAIALWGIPFLFTYHSSMLAEACLRAGSYQEAVEAVAAGREHVTRTGEHYGESELERVAGETLMLMGAAYAIEAGQCLRRAVAIAREQGAKSWELRATVSLARLLVGQGRRDEARAMLAEIYGWFTEGFDTADLKDAKALLDHMNE
jgi:class 3 adenylate cyclase/tetratricopeptide (TPR) repeat protein